MNAHITYATLLALIPEETSGRAPTAKYLKEHDTPIAINEGGTAICYASGFVCYTSILGTTVFSIHKCNRYTYDSTVENASMEISESDLLAMEWYFPVMLYGESRLEQNREIAEHSHRYEFCQEESVEDIPDKNAAIPANFDLQQLCQCLTERQRTMFLLSVIEGYTHAEIARIFSVKRNTVTETIKNATDKIRNFVQNAEI